jgi:hypothetical protein
MISRDEYVQKLKSQIDHWNAEAASWEAKARQAQAGVQAQYAKQLEQYRARRHEALAELRRMQNASADAWRDMMRGADSAMKSMQEALDKARRQFDKKK